MTQYDMSNNTFDNAVPQVRVAFTFINDGKDWQGGVNYFRSLFNALAMLPHSPITIHAFVGSKADASKLLFPSNVRVIRNPVLDRRSFKWMLNKLAQRHLGQPWLMNRLLQQHGIAVSSHGEASRNRTVRSIGWIPDFQHIHLPQFFSAEERATRSTFYRRLIENSDLIVVSSESARADLAQFAPDLAGKARVLRFCAVQPEIDASALLDVRGQYGISGRYFYLPNQFWAHKNHALAVEALAEIAATYPDAQVVCSGAMQDYRNPGHLAQLKQQIAQLGLSDKFILLGLIPYTHIAQLMLQSVAVINPSLFEGWSTTVEEAKALGVRMLLSNLPVHLEQCTGENASFFDPHNASTLAACMSRELESAQPQRKTSDIEAALARHGDRIRAFGYSYEQIVLELCGMSVSHQH